MKKLDWYILRKFMGTFFLALFLIVCVAVVFDISEKIDNFIDKGATVGDIIIKYYLNFIPNFANLFCALFVFISVIFFTSKMAGKSEFIAMFASGISKFRLLKPYFVGGILITAFSFILGYYVIPDCNKERLAFEEKYVSRTGNRISLFNIHRQLEPGVYFYIESYNKEHNVGLRMSLEKFDGVTLKSKTTADMLQWNSEKQSWKIKDYCIRTFEDGKESIETGAEKDTVFRITPDDFFKKTTTVEALNSRELREYIAEQKLSGTSAVISSEIELYNRMATPFSTFVLTIIGFALSVKKRRGGLGLNIILGMLLSFSYILFQRFSTTFALSGLLSPVLAVWVPNFIFALIAIVVYFTAAK
ncbi:MAG: LptF/LptG family permease [Bacteroidales bacterium]|nr:LptF/LptG family permease [Bacteroidales bacterium]